MKLLTVLLVSAMACTAFAKKDKHDSLKAEFNSMTAAQALASNKFEKKFGNKYIPGTSTWYNPQNLCIDGGNIETIKPVKFCEEWSVKFDGGKVKTYAYKSQADDAADLEDAKGDAFCSSVVTKIASGPMNYTVNSCVLWSKKDKDGDKKFYSKDPGDDANCAEMGPVAKSISNTFRVTFYSDRDREDELGSHTYRLPSCQSDMTLPPVPAN